MRFIPFRFNSLSFHSQNFFIFDFSIKFGFYRFCDLPKVKSVSFSSILSERTSNVAIFSVFDELFFRPFKFSETVFVKKPYRFYVSSELDPFAFMGFLRFMFFFPDTKNLVSSSFSPANERFVFRFKDFTTLYSFFDFRLSLSNFYPVFRFAFTFQNADNSEFGDYFISFFNSLLFKVSFDDLD